MAEDTVQYQSVQAPPAPEAHAASGSDALVRPDFSMMVLTWIVFFAMFAILYKVAWKPILAGLDKREKDIRKALEDAAKAREEVERIEQTRRQVMAEADAKAAEIIAAARQSASELAQTLQTQAREETQRAVENSRREIQAAEEKAREALRRETAELALAIASTVVRENLDEPKNRALVQRMIQEL